MKNTKLKYLLLLHLVVIIWSTTAILGKLITVDSGVLVWYRMLIAVAGIAAYFVITKKSFKIPRAMFVKTFLVGFLVAGHWVCFFESIKLSNVSIGLVCLSLAPFFVSIIEPVLFKRRFRTYEGLLGVSTVIGMGSIYTFESQYLAGIVVGLFSVFLSSLFIVINGILVRECPARLISFYELIGGWCGVSAYVFLIQNKRIEELTIEGADVVYLMVLGLVCTSFAYIGAVEVMRVLTPFTAMLTVNLEPVYGIVLGLLIFGETEFMSLGFYLGAVLIIASIFTNGYVIRRFRPRGITKDHETI